MRVGVRPARHARPGDRAVGRVASTGARTGPAIAERMSRDPGPDRRADRPRPRPGAPARPANLTLVDPAATLGRRPGRRWPAAAATRRTPGWSCRRGWWRRSCTARPTVLDGKVTEVNARREATAGARGRPDLPRRGVRQRRRDVRRGGLHHRDDRLPGDADRPVVPPPGRGADRAAHRQHRRQRRGRRVGPDLGRRLRGARPGPAPVELAVHRRRWRTGWPPRASSASAASTPGR